MWQIYAMQALELARERQREADAVRLARLAAAGRREMGDLPVGGRSSRRVGWLGRVGLRLVVGALHRLGAGAESVAAAAHAAAARLGRSGVA